MSPQKILAVVDFVLSLIGIPIGTYYLYNETWWGSYIGPWSAKLAGTLMTVMMCYASANLFESTNRGISRDTAKERIVLYLHVTESFQLYVLVSSVAFANPLLWTNPYLMLVLGLGFLIRMPCLWVVRFHYLDQQPEIHRDSLPTTIISVKIPHYPAPDIQQFRIQPDLISSIKIVRCPYRHFNGTYFLYVDTWWCNIIGYWSAVVVGVVLTTMMLNAPFNYIHLRIGTDLERLDTWWLIMLQSGAFEFCSFAAISLLTSYGRNIYCGYFDFDSSFESPAFSKACLT
ncbi:hypothetical protein Ocin01_14440 [Orchesella cincta]|uniref:Uncharacterized protein n=1 Tax=Orchesella cincta TaxID=48709 RepID=A0A1D2MH51_ORCCI|nr:hypothetical protein Ocin01_14440 [Orchesella cincta]